ncbi:MAG: restriction endonuclease subunit S [Flavobacteriales bacterium]
MPTNWKKYKLSDLGTVARGKSKHRPRDAAHLYGGNYPFIQTGDVKAASHKLYKHSQTYSEAGLAQSKLWPKGTMCITIAANIAETSILTYPACFPDSIIGFIADESICDIDFIEFMMQYFKKEVQSHSIGSVQDNINLGTFERLQFLIPPLPEQKAIAQILSAIDDKIENNLAINKTLEDMAMALYKHWFVDFGPFQDGEFVDSELGLIPIDWEVKRLEELSEIGSSKRIFLKEYVEEGIPFYRGKEIIQLSKGTNISTELFITEERFKEIKSKFGVPVKGDILISSVGTIGVSWLVDDSNEFYFKDGNLTWLKKYKTFLKGEFLHLWLNSKVGQEQILGETIGSTQQALTISSLRSLKLVFPPKSIYQKIEQDIINSYNQIQLNLLEIKTLTKLRDTLLPKLISGDVRLNEFREQVEPVVARNEAIS